MPWPDGSTRSGKLAAHMKIELDTRISTLRETYLRRLRPEVFEIVVDGLRKAGFPE